MPYIRLTLVRPKAGREDEILDLLGRIDRTLSPSPDLLFSAVIRDEAIADDRGCVGRVSLWESKGQANLEARGELTLALRSQLLPLVDEIVAESLLEVKSGWFPGELMPKAFQQALYPSESAA